jgi:hypothetical protein
VAIPQCVETQYYNYANIHNGGRKRELVTVTHFTVVYRQVSFYTRLVFLHKSRKLKSYKSHTNHPIKRVYFLGLRDRQPLLI